MNESRCSNVLTRTNNDVKAATEATQNSNMYDFLTLGDGDFSYSYDLCRFLQAQAAVNETRSSSNQQVKIKVVCSGIDPLAELQKKYKDAEFIRNKIQALSGSVPSIRKEESLRRDDRTVKRPRIHHKPGGSTSLTVSIHHSVNAIVPWHEFLADDQQQHNLVPSPQLPKCTYRNVIFNHPHIGTEDAGKHSRFLSHFFYSANTHWLAPNGMVHLSLVKGQCERWKCLDASEKHGFVLVHRDTFKPPPAPGKYIKMCIDLKEMDESIGKKSTAFRSKQDFKCRYQNRRHQSGRSFGSRAKGGSETLSFRRKDELQSRQIDELILNHLPWQKLTYNDDSRPFKCAFCEKSFGDERARKNHIKVVHDADAKIAKSGGDPKPVHCEICNNDRVFPSIDALVAHKKAKHFGKFTELKPNWATSAKAKDTTECILISEVAEIRNDESEKNNNKELCSTEVFKPCTICGLEFTSQKMMQHHFDEFIPEFSTNDNTVKSIEDLLPFPCSICDKRFRDERARKQHENFCSGCR